MSSEGVFLPRACLKPTLDYSALYFILQALSHESLILGTYKFCIPESIILFLKPNTN